MKSSTKVKNFGATAQANQWEDEDDDSPPMLAEERRKSVFTRGYIPNDENDEDCREFVSHSKSEQTKKKLESSIKDNLLFRGLEPEQMIAIINVMREVRVKKGDQIIKQGDDGDYFYVIESGTFEALVRNENGTDSTMQIYKESGSFGELALMYNQPRQATVIALSDGCVYSLSRNEFRKIVVKSAHVRRSLYRELINKVLLFESLSEVEKLKIGDVLVTIVFSDGETIIKQGDDADGMYFVISGSVKISKTIGKEEVLVKVINSGEYFGELALLKNKPRAANVIASGPTKVAFLAAEAFTRLMGPCHEMMNTHAEDYV